jgi:ABC-type molybdenum transport system ATPase subunit/photorepair protein PhrA
LFPFLSLRDPPADPFTSVSLVSFSHRPKFSTGFYDYSARYGAVRDQDKLTLRQTLFPELQAQVRKAELNLDVDNLPVDKDQIRLLEYLIGRLDLTRLLDLPLIALSNGQTRKARIVKALIGGLNVTPELVILDEGLSMFILLLMHVNRLSWI